MPLLLGVYLQYSQWYLETPDQLDRIQELHLGLVDVLQEDSILLMAAPRSLDSKDCLNFQDCSCFFQLVLEIKPSCSLNCYDSSLEHI
nr:hypothetical protein Iba_scaffold446CG0410 [Ipomoea batatas]